MTIVFFPPASFQSHLLRILLWYVALRPHLLLPAWACALTGGAWAAATLDWQESDLRPEFWLLAGLAWSAALAAIHLLNLAADQDNDRANLKNRFWHGRILRWHLYKTATFVAGGAVVLAGSLGRVIGVGVLITLILGISYSLPPIQLSRRWGWDMLANGLGYGLIAPWYGACLFVGSSSPIPFPWPVIVVLFPLVAAAFLWTTIIDLPGDKLTGKISFSVRWGERRSCLVASLLTWIGCGLAWGFFLSSTVTGWNPVAVATGGPDSMINETWLGSITLLAAVGTVLCIKKPRPAVLIGVVVLAVAVAALPALVRWPEWLFVGFLWLLITYTAQGILKKQLSGLSNPQLSGPLREPTAP